MTNVNELATLDHYHHFHGHFGPFVYSCFALTSACKPTNSGPPSGPVSKMTISVFLATIIMVHSLKDTNRECYIEIELKLGLIQTQMTQKFVLRAERHAHAIRTSQNRKCRKYTKYKKFRILRSALTHVTPDGNLSLI